MVNLTKKEGRASLRSPLVENIYETKNIKKHLLLHLDDAHVGLGVAQNEAACLGEYCGVDVAHTTGLEVECFGAEWHVGVLLQVLGVDNHAGTLHAALVKYLAQQHVEGAEFRAQLSEVGT